MTAARGKQFLPHLYRPTSLGATAVSRASRILFSALGAVANPLRADLVACVGEGTGTVSLQRIHDRMMASKEGQSVLLNKPLLNSHTMKEYTSAPSSSLHPHPQSPLSSSLGSKYALFMRERNLSADRPLVRYIQDPELAYVMQRYREVHDLWHVLYNVEIDVCSEIALKWIELSATGLPMCAMSGMFGPLSLAVNDQKVLLRVYWPWAMEASKALKVDLMSLYYENYMDKDIDTLRKDWGIVVAPNK